MITPNPTHQAAHSLSFKFYGKQGLFIALSSPWLLLRYLVCQINRYFVQSYLWLILPLLKFQLDFGAPFLCKLSFFLAGLSDANEF